MAKELTIDVVSDVICPWCYIGKRRLEKALNILGAEVDARIRWLPFQLNPEMPKEGMARADYRKAKFGSAERARGLDARVAAEGRGEGIEFAFERIARTPNTVHAHQLIDLAQRQAAESAQKQQGVGTQVVDALFRAYFEEVQDVGDPALLAAIAERCGVRDWPQAADQREVASLEENMRALGISAVPTFVFDRKIAVSGAHPPQALAAAIRQALGEVQTSV